MALPFQDIPFQGAWLWPWPFKNRTKSTNSIYKYQIIKNKDKHIRTQPHVLIDIENNTEYDNCIVERMVFPGAAPCGGRGEDEQEQQQAQEQPQRESQQHHLQQQQLNNNMIHFGDELGTRRWDAP